MTDQATLPAKYDPNLFENKWRPWWQKNDVFAYGPEITHRNITGILHTGLAFNHKVHHFVGVGFYNFITPRSASCVLL